MASTTTELAFVSFLDSWTVSQVSPKKYGDFQAMQANPEYPKSIASSLSQQCYQFFWWLHLSGWVRLVRLTQPSVVPAGIQGAPRETEQWEEAPSHQSCGERRSEDLLRFDVPMGAEASF